VLPLDGRTEHRSHNLLRLVGFDSIREALQALMHDIQGLMGMLWRQPALNIS